MKKQGLVLIGCLLYASAGFGSSSTIAFDAARDCRAQNTTTGIRYVPPCDFNPQVIEPDQHKVLASAADLTRGLFKSTAFYSFNCESLRPLSLTYTIRENDVIVEIGNVAAAATPALLKNSITHSYDAAAFAIESLQGLSGIQALKPGCSMRVESFASYPEPEYFKLMANSQINVDNLLKNIFASTQPDMSYATALGAIGNAQLLLSFLRPQSDPLTQGMIDITVQSLIDAESILAQQCQADSTTLLCSQAIANTRATLLAEIIGNEQRLIELRDYLASQVNWLAAQPQDLSTETEKLQSAWESLQQQLTP